MIITDSVLRRAINAALNDQINTIVAEEAEAAAVRVRERIMPAVEQVAANIRMWHDQSERCDHLEITVKDGRK